MIYIKVDNVLGKTLIKNAYYKIYYVANSEREMYMIVEKIRIRHKDDFNTIKILWNNLQDGFDMTVFQSYEWNIKLYMEWHNSLINRITGKIEVFILRTDNGKVIAMLPLIILNYLPILAVQMLLLLMSSISILL